MSWARVGKEIRKKKKEGKGGETDGVIQVFPQYSRFSHNLSRPVGAGGNLSTPFLILYRRDHGRAIPSRNVKRGGGKPRCVQGATSCGNVWCCRIGVQKVCCSFISPARGEEGRGQTLTSEHNRNTTGLHVEEEEAVCQYVSWGSAMGVFRFCRTRLWNLRAEEDRTPG